ncbi:MAG: tetraacyldisaccharide 4'-kinase [Rikenellaceae bacterium]|nr:tetraacyldisaccharide 4'-kinase [Rikenellaceae bacterium]
MRDLLYMPLSFLYGMVVNLRHNLFDWGVLKSEKFDIPIICIGNITVGGTGKTPMAELLINFLKRSHNVALLSRGYGRRTKGYREVTIDAHYRDVGDEPLQIKRKFPDTVVVVCEKRVEGIKRVRAEHPEVNLIVMDDGFQHRYVQPKINVLMVDSTRPIQNDKMLPAGTLRDQPEQLYRAHYFVVTKCPEKMAPIDRRILRKVLIKYAYQRIYFTRFESFTPQPVFQNEADMVPLIQRGKIIALSGIGNPKPFLQTLSEKYRIVDEVTLKDHHVYRVRDIQNLEQLLRKNPGAVIVTTEKDAVKMGRSEKIPALVRRSLYYMPIDITFIEDSATDFLQKIEEDVKGN